MYSAVCFVRADVFVGCGLFLHAQASIYCRAADCIYSDHVMKNMTGDLTSCCASYMQ